VGAENKKTTLRPPPKLRTVVLVYSLEDFRNLSNTHILFQKFAFSAVRSDVVRNIGENNFTFLYFFSLWLASGKVLSWENGRSVKRINTSELGVEIITCLAAANNFTCYVIKEAQLSKHPAPLLLIAESK